MEGVIHIEFLNQGTANSEQYIATLQMLKSRLEQIWYSRDSVLQVDNVSQNTSGQTQDVWVQLKLPTLLHSAYNPDLVPPDYFLFSQLKTYLEGSNDNGEVVAAVYRGKPSEFIVDFVHQMIQGKSLCIYSNGDYDQK